MSNSTADLCHPDSLSSSLISPPNPSAGVRSRPPAVKASSPRPQLSGRGAGTSSPHSTQHSTTQPSLPPPTTHVPLGESLCTHDLAPRSREQGGARPDAPGLPLPGLNSHPQHSSARLISAYRRYSAAGGKAELHESVGRPRGLPPLPHRRTARSS